MFCRHCGAKLKEKHSSPHLPKNSIFNKKYYRIWIVVIVVIALSAGTAYAAPMVNGYLGVNSAIGNAKKLEAKGDYTDALAALNSAEGLWSFRSNKQALESLKAQEGSYIQDQNNYNLALSEEASTTLGASSLTNAQALLQSIPDDYPGYGQVVNAISSVQSEIENQLQNQTLQAQDEAQAAQAEKAQADAQDAQAQAAAAAAAKDKASAQASAAAAAQAQAEANAQAVAEAAAAAQAQANAQQQVLISFYNQLQSTYRSVNGDGINYYNSGNTDYEEGTELSELDAITEFGQAEAIDKTAMTNATDLGSFTNMPANYVNAGENMEAAANACYQAANIGIENAGNSAYGNSYISPNTYVDNCNEFMSDVNSFLNSTNP